MDTLRILVVDDHDDFRRGLQALLDATANLEVVGVATNGETAVRCAWTCSPTSCSWTCTCPASTASRPPSGSCGPRPTSASWW